MKRYLLWSIALVSSIYPTSMAWGSENTTPKAIETSSHEGLEYAKIFGQITDNHNLFNTLNKKLFQEASREDWIRRFKVREQRFTEIYQQNDENLNKIYHYFCETNQATKADYDSLLHYTVLSFKDGNDNPFVAEKALKVLLDHYLGEKKKRASKLATCHYLLGLELLKIGDYGDEACYSEAMENLLQCNKIGTLFFANVDTDLTRSFILSSYFKLSSYQLMTFGLISTEKQLELRDQLVQLRNNPENKPYFDRSEQLCSMVDKMLASFNYRIVRYKVAPQWMHSNTKVAQLDAREEALNDSISRVYLQSLENKRNKELSYEENLMKGFLRCKNGNIKANTFLSELEDYIMGQMVDAKNFSYSRMSRYFTTVYMLFAALDHSTLDASNKREKANYYCHNIQKFFEECQTRENAYKDLSEWSYFASTPTIYKYLDNREARNWTTTMGLKSNPINYITASYTADIVELITKAIIENKPELLVGCHDTKTIKDVMEQKENIISFMKSSSLLHGLGRSRMPEVYFYRLNYYMPHESELIARYPEQAKIFIECNKTLAKYHDLLMANYHADKYPNTYTMDNPANAPLIEILNLAHHLDGTHSENRESIYKHKDTEELIKWAHTHEGVLYRKEFVDVIENTPAVFNELKIINEDLWEDKMYDLYRWYFNKSNK